MIEPEPASLWTSPPMIGLYGTVIVGLIPIVLLCLKKRWRMKT